MDIHYTYVFDVSVSLNAMQCKKKTERKNERKNDIKQNKIKR